MKRPWMPLTIADYLRKTTHLGALESGAYLHLIMDYWQNDGLPDDDKKLARIAKLTDREWRANKATLQEFFHDGWKHDRIDEEIAKAGIIAESNTDKARGAANKRWAKHNASKQDALHQASLGDAGSNAPECTLNTKQEERKKDAAFAAPEAELFDRGKQVLGQSGGGLIKNLLKAKGGNIAMARIAIEQASQKQNPREYIGAIINQPAKEQLSARERGDAW